MKSDDIESYIKGYGIHQYYFNFQMTETFSYLLLPIKELKSDIEFV